MEWLKGLFFRDTKSSEYSESVVPELSEHSLNNFRYDNKNQSQNLHRDFTSKVSNSKFGKGSENFHYDNNIEKSAYSKGSNRFRENRSESHHRQKNYETSEKMSIKSGKGSVHRGSTYGNKYDYEKMWKDKMKKVGSHSRSRSRSPVEKKLGYIHKNRRQDESRSRKSESRFNYEKDSRRKEHYRDDERSRHYNDHDKRISRDSYENRREDSKNRRNYEHEKQKRHHRDYSDEEDCRRSKSRYEYNRRDEKDEFQKNKESIDKDYIKNQNDKKKFNKVEKDRQRKISESSDSDDSSDSLDLKEVRSFATNQISNHRSNYNQKDALNTSGMLNNSFEMPPQSLDINKTAMSPSIVSNFRPGQNVNQLAMTPLTKPMDSPGHRSILLESPMHQSMISGESPIHPSMALSVESPIHHSMRENLLTDPMINPIIEGNNNSNEKQSPVKQSYINEQIYGNDRLRSYQNHNDNQQLENQFNDDGNNYIGQQVGNLNNNKILSRSEIDQRPVRFEVPINQPIRSNNLDNSMSFYNMNSNNQGYNFMNQPIKKVQSYEDSSNLTSGMTTPNPERVINRNFIDTVSQISRGDSVLRASLESKFTQKTREVTNVGARPRCFNCGEWGHTNRECTKPHYNKVIFSTVKNPEKFKDLPRKKAATNKNYLKRINDKVVVDYIRFGKNEFPSQAEIARENEQKFAEYTSEFDQKEMQKYLTLELQDLKQASIGDTYENFMEEVNQPNDPFRMIFEFTFSLDGRYEGQKNEFDRMHGKGSFATWNNDRIVGIWEDSELKVGVNHEIYYSNGNQYIGNIQNYHLEGSGTLMFKNGSKYEGPFHLSQMSGEGSLYYSNEGNYYFGGFRENKKQGKGTMVYSNGDKYFGDWHHDMRHGYGEYYYKKGDCWSGEFKFDNMRGLGFMEYQNGNIAKVLWRDTHQLLSGQIIYANGNAYLGQFDNNLRNGTGTIIFKNKAKYRGTFANGNMHGDGKMVITKPQLQYQGFLHDFNLYRGSFFENQRHGEGVFTYFNGDQYDGMFENNVRTGQSKYRFENGSAIVANFVNDQLHGRGQIIDLSGVVHKGTFRTLDVEFYEPEPPIESLDDYQGIFDYGVKSGNGEFQLIDGSKVTFEYEHEAIKITSIGASMLMDMLPPTIGPPSSLLPTKNLPYCPNLKVQQNQATRSKEIIPFPTVLPPDLNAKVKNPYDSYSLQVKAAKKNLEDYEEQQIREVEKTPVPEKYKK